MIRTRNLRKYFGSNHVLRGIDLTIEDGEVLVIVGSSGSGKSTLLRCLNLLEKPTYGSVFVDDVDITQPHVNINKIRQRIGMVFQQFNLFNNFYIKIRPKFNPIFFSNSFVINYLSFFIKRVMWCRRDFKINQIFCSIGGEQF